MKRHLETSLKFNQTIRGKVLLFIGVLAIYVGTLFVYSFNQKDILLEKITEIDVLQEAETVLLAADLAVFDAITQLLIILDPLDKNQVLQGAHKHFNILTEHYQKLSKLYPERAPSFYALIGSLAKVIMKPTSEDLKAVKVNLERHKIDLRGLISTNQRNRQELFKSYKRISDNAVNNLIVFTLIALIVIIVFSSLFFNHMAKDIKRILLQITDIVARNKCVPLRREREDEIGILIDGINDMSTALDIRDQQLHVERIDSSYFESIGAIEKLTTGLVHELGNPIAAISGLVSEIEYSAENLSPELQNYLISIKDYSYKLQQINGDLAKLASPTSKTFKLLDLNDVIDHVANLLHYDERWYGVEVKCALAPMLPAIFASDGQLRLLLNNVLTNCLEAQTRTPHVVEMQTLYQDERIILTIKDNGCGMDVDTLVKAQAPFFTTKNQSVHSGMGLFSAATIVNNFNGELDIQSQLDKGTSVTITLDVNATATDDSADNNVQHQEKTPEGDNA